MINYRGSRYAAAFITRYNYLVITYFEFEAFLQGSEARELASRLDTCGDVDSIDDLLSSYF